MKTSTNNETKETYTRHELQCREGLQEGGRWVAHSQDPAQSKTEYRDAANKVHPGRWRVVFISSTEIVNTTTIQEFTVLP